MDNAKEIAVQISYYNSFFICYAKRVKFTVKVIGPLLQISYISVLFSHSKSIHNVYIMFIKIKFVNFIDFIINVGTYSKDIYIIPYNGVGGLISHIGFLFITKWGGGKFSYIGGLSFNTLGGLHLEINIYRKLFYLF